MGGDGEGRGYLVRTFRVALVILELVDMKKDHIFDKHSLYVLGYPQGYFYPNNQVGILNNTGSDLFIFHQFWQNLTFLDLLLSMIASMGHQQYLWSVKECNDSERISPSASHLPSQVLDLCALPSDHYASLFPTTPEPAVFFFLFDILLLIDSVYFFIDQKQMIIWLHWGDN